MAKLLHPQGRKNPPYTPNKRMGAPPGQPGHSGEEKN